MSDIAIRVENLSKRYRIGRRERYMTLRESLTGAFTAPFRRRTVNSQSEIRNSNSEYIWALKDVSFEIKHGEAVGVIGRNGAGKSTLLKVLSRITKPTQGRAEIHGRIGSLLEVGTGFHPELTGRDNIYLNGAILGMQRVEIARKFDEIVAFAEIEKFIETPVKHYSSGMYMRLAFAVAANLEPEILLVDEVLAVGDIAFQKKCIGKMGEVSGTGRTVLFVSHNMPAIRKLCKNALLISEGQLLAQGLSVDITARYEALMLEGQITNLPPGVLYTTNAVDTPTPFAITRLEMLDGSGASKPSLSTWDSVCFRIHYRALDSVREGSAEFCLMSPDGLMLLLCSTQPDSNIPMRIMPGTGTVDCYFPQWPFAAGRYLVDVALAVPMKENLCHLPAPASLDVLPRDVFNSGTIVPHTRRALLAIPHEWRPM